MFSDLSFPLVRIRQFSISFVIYLSVTSIAYKMLYTIGNVAFFSKPNS